MPADLLFSLGLRYGQQINTLVVAQLLAAQAPSVIQPVFLQSEHITVAALVMTEIVRINASGPAVQFGSEGWSADQYFSGGRTFIGTDAISNTTNDAIYQSERYGDFTYNIPVPSSGKYTVELHFAELYVNKAGSRVFNVSVESGQFLKQNIDLFKDYGGKYTASVIKAENVQVNDGFLTIAFTSVVNNAKISGIAVFLQSEPVNRPPVLANPGDISLTTGQSWSYQVVASDPDAGAVLTYSAINLPASLTLNPTTGLITGNVSESPGNGIPACLVQNNLRKRVAASILFTGSCRHQQILMRPITAMIRPAMSTENRV